MILLSAFFKYNKLGQLCSISLVDNFYDASDVAHGFISPAHNYKQDGEMIEFVLLMQALTWPVATAIAVVSIKRTRNVLYKALMME